MKIIKIEVKKLFGVFNHEIPLNTKDHITIIHSPNGYGKTILLSLVNAIFSSQYQKLRSIPFNELSIYFDNKSNLCLKRNGSVEKIKKKKLENEEQLTIALYKPPSKPKIHPASFYIETDDLTRYFFEVGLERATDRTWLYLPTEEELTFTEIFNRFGDRLPILQTKIENPPAWLIDIINSININFIDTQRLLNVPDFSRDSKKDSLRRTKRSLMSPLHPAVINYSQELAKAIQGKLADYGSLSQSLERTFPTRLVKRKPLAEPTIEKLKIELSELEKKRSRLIAAGFLEKEKDIDFKDFQDVDQNNIKVLSIYIDDAKQKLSVFDELAEKIDLLSKIINKRFLHKNLSISKTDGFIFKTTEGKIIPPTSLSSGEQHELVLLYEMLFKVKPNSLILIDEPEISLHVAWQQEFLKDLQEITRLVGFDVLIATHSPQIINDRWDLTVELKGPKQ